MEKMIPQLEHIDDSYDKEEWVASKIQHIVTSIDEGADDASNDEKVRNASRSFRQSFDVPPSERLVNCEHRLQLLPRFLLRIDLIFIPDYSCAYNGRQGWLYISENYMGFYSFLLGVETKLLVELKNIQDMKKEKSKRNMFSDSLLIVTKDKKEVSKSAIHETCTQHNIDSLLQHHFSNLFRRDEVS